MAVSPLTSMGHDVILSHSINVIRKMVDNSEEPGPQASQATKGKVKLASRQVVHDLHVCTIRHVWIYAVKPHVQERALAVVVDAVKLRFVKQQCATLHVCEATTNRAGTVSAHTILRTKKGGHFRHGAPS